MGTGKVKTHRCLGIAAATSEDGFFLLQFAVEHGEPLRVAFPKTAVAQLRAILEEVEATLAKRGGGH